MENSSFEEVGERLGTTRALGVRVPSADELRIGMPRWQGGAVDADFSSVPEPNVRLSSVDVSDFQQPYRVAKGVLSALSDDTSTADGGPLHGQRPLEDPDLPVTDASSGGGDKPPIERPPQDGAADVPDEPDAHTEGHIHTPGVLEGTIDRLSPPSRRVDIHNGERYDVVTNLAHPDRELAKRAAEQLRDGIPSSWSRVDIPNGRRYYVDSQDQPTLFAKTRAEITTAQYTVRRDQIDVTGANVEDIDGEYARIRAEHSVLNEMQLAAQVREVLEEETLQEMVRSRGFAGLSIVEPVAAISDKQIGEKTVVYQYQNGVPVEDPFTGIPAIPEQFADGVADIMVTLEDGLWTQGIVPHDHTLSQYLVETDEYGDYHLHLTDIERFTKQTTAEAPSTEVSTMDADERMLPPGGVEYYQNRHWHEADSLTERDGGGANLYKVSPDGMLVGRRREVGESPVLHSQLHDGRAVAIWNEQTGEGGMVHFSRRAMQTEDLQYQAIRRLFNEFPGLGAQNCRAWVVGDELHSPATESDWFNNETIRSTLWEMGIADPQSVSIPYVQGVSLDVADGSVQLLDGQGNPLPFDSNL